MKKLFLISIFIFSFFLLSQTSFAAFEGAKAYRTGAQSITNSTSTLVQLNTEVFDPSSRFDTSTYKFIAGVSGYYQVNAAVYYGGISAASTEWASITVNGSEVSSCDMKVPATGGDIKVECSDLIYLNVNDYVQLYTYQNSGSSQALVVGAGNTFLSIGRLVSDSDIPTSFSWSSITSKPTTLSGYGITDAVPSSRTVTINGTGCALSSDCSFTVTGSGGGSGDVTVTANLPSDSFDPLVLMWGVLVFLIITFGLMFYFKKRI